MSSTNKTATYGLQSPSSSHNKGKKAQSQRIGTQGKVDSMLGHPTKPLSKPPPRIRAAPQGPARRMSTPSVTDTTRTSLTSPTRTTSTSTPITTLTDTTSTSLPTTESTTHPAPSDPTPSRPRGHVKFTSSEIQRIKDQILSRHNLKQLSNGGTELRAYLNLASRIVYNMGEVKFERPRPCYTLRWGEVLKTCQLLGRRRAATNQYDMLKWVGNQGSDVVYMHCYNAYNSHCITMGAHGFVWIFSDDNQTVIPWNDKFHLFTSSKEAGHPLDHSSDAVYRGCFFAHRPGVFLSPEAFFNLHNHTRSRAFAIRSDPKLVNDAQHTIALWEKFRSGHYKAELVILEFCGHLNKKSRAEIAAVQEKIHVAMLETQSALRPGEPIFTTQREVLEETDRDFAKTSRIIGPRVLNSHLRG